MHGFDEGRKELLIQFPDKEAYDRQREELFAALSDMDGNDAVVIYIASPRMLNRLDARWHICVNKDTKEVLEDMFGAKNVKVIQKNIEFGRKRY